MFDSFLVFRDGENAEKKRLLRLGIKPFGCAWIGFIAAHLRDDICVEQPAIHRSTSLPASISLSTSSAPRPISLRKRDSGAAFFCLGRRRLYCSGGRIKAASLPRTVTSCGPAVAARRTTSLRRALASSSFHRSTTPLPGHTTVS